MGAGGGGFGAGAGEQRAAFALNFAVLVFGQVETAAAFFAFDDCHEKKSPFGGRTRLPRL